MRIRLISLSSWIAFLAACQATSSPPNQPPAPPTPAATSVTPPAAPAGSMAVAASPPRTPVTPPEQESPSMRRFDDDVQFLNQHGAALQVLEAPSGARVAISGKYQARVMTSTFEAHGPSLGFVNRSFVEAGKTGTAFDNYGGEDRFWLGPEGGQYALYFAPQKPFSFAHWQTPHAFQEGEWQASASSPTSVTYRHSLSVTNYAKTEFKMAVERQLSLLGAEQVTRSLGVTPPSGVRWVAFASQNSITNRSAKAWSEDRGLPSIWILGMFNPAPGTRIVLPFETGASGDIVSDRYFGKVPPERLQIDEKKGFVLFKADGQARGKVGLPPARAKSVLGSYSAEARLLTLVRFTKPAGAKRYVNNLWEISKEPYGGDVSNAYNDGPVEPGGPSLGGFYELESSSPAAALAPGATLTHTHETYHFTGPEPALESIALKVLGVSLSDIRGAKL